MNWLFLRGLSRESGHWGNFVKVFEKEIPGAKVYHLDLPGFGTEFERRSPVRISKIVEDVRSRWLQQKSKIESDSPWSLLALSLGAMVGGDWVSKHPEDFKNFVAINSSAANLSPTWRRLKPLRIADLNRIRKMPLGSEREKAVLKMTTRLIKNPDKIAEEWGKIAHLRPPRSRNAIAQLLAALSFIAKPDLKVSTLVLSSLKDDFTDSRCSDDLAKHWGAKQSVHPEGGHDLPLDDPEWVARQVRSHFQSF